MHGDEPSPSLLYGAVSPSRYVPMKGPHPVRPSAAELEMLRLSDLNAIELLRVSRLDAVAGGRITRNVGPGA